MHTAVCHVLDGTQNILHLLWAFILCLFLMQSFFLLMAACPEEKSTAKLFAEEVAPLHLQHGLVFSCLLSWRITIYVKYAKGDVNEEDTEALRYRDKTVTTPLQHYISPITLCAFITISPKFRNTKQN
jgi:cytochrome b561